LELRRNSDRPFCHLFRNAFKTFVVFIITSEECGCRDERFFGFWCRFSGGFRFLGFFRLDKFWPLGFIDRISPIRRATAFAF
jgi:hypothetical protein